MFVKPARSLEDLFQQRHTSTTELKDCNEEASNRRQDVASSGSGPDDVNRDGKDRNEPAREWPACSSVTVDLCSPDLSSELFAEGFLEVLFQASLNISRLGSL